MLAVFGAGLHGGQGSEFGVQYGLGFRSGFSETEIS